MLNKDVIIKWASTYKYIYIVFFIVVSISIGIGSAFFIQAPKPTLISQETTDIQTEKKIYVDIKGAVNHEGIYEMAKDSRVKDVVEQAGGFTDNADRKAVNLAQLVYDEMMIIIPNIDEQNDLQSTKINLNTATKSQLMTIAGIGEKKADAILEYRKQKRLTKIEDLKQIKGFSDSLIEKIKPLVSLSCKENGYFLV
ncbi:helix-hairpin-helix domain-containing protein [Granulicatella sp. zg-ZJ]|uniref:helix-hairpin-helix domain-containing protein n=1 Tax=Granulicatella sp. zg-ZJ TaxID=2678504 RepID=UPI00351B461C